MNKSNQNPDLRKVWNVLSNQENDELCVHFYPQGHIATKKSCDIYYEDKLMYQNTSFFHIFEDGTRVVEHDSGVKFYDNNGKLLQDLTQTFKRLFGDWILFFACRYQTLILTKDDTILATSYKALNQNVILPDGDWIREIADNVSGFIAVSRQNESIVYNSDYTVHKNFNGRVKFADDNCFYVKNNDELSCYNLQFEEQSLPVSLPTEQITYPVDGVLERYRLMGTQVQIVWKHFVYVRYQKMDIVLDLNLSKEEHLEIIKDFLAQKSEISDGTFRYMMAILQLLDYPISKKDMLLAVL